MDRIELRLKMEAETKKASDNENGTRTDVSEEYVKWLEHRVKNCFIPDVVGQSEQLKAFNEQMSIDYHWYVPVPEEDINKYIKSL